MLLPLIALAVLLAPPPAAPLVKAPPAPALFGLHWGDPVGPEMVKMTVTSGTGAEFYRRPADKLKLEGVPLEHIMYAFKNGRLAGISIKLALARRDDLSRALTRLWGPPRPDPDGSVMWSAPTHSAILRQLKPPFDKSCTLNVFAR